MNKNHQATCRPNQVTLAIFAALATMATPILAEPMQLVPFYRNSDTARWSDNYVELGAAYMDAKSNTPKAFKFGEFSGLNEQGAFGTLGFNYLARSRADDAINLHIYGANLGLDTFKFLLEGGKQGSFSASISADRLTRAELDSAKFLHDGLGGSTLSNPAGYSGLSAGEMANSNNAAAINAQMKSFDISQQRDIFRLNLATVAAQAWDFKVNYREDKRDGSRLTGTLFTSAAILPYQIDDKTQQVETQLSYTTKRVQAQLGYTYSKYENALNSFTWANPFRTSATVAGNFNVPGTMSLMPSNEFHQLSFTGALNLAKTTRLTTLLSRSIGTQNDPFLAYTSNPGVASNPVGTNLTSTAALPRSSLDGKIINTAVDIALTSRPLDRMNFKLAYQFRDSDNRTPTTTYRSVGFDSSAQPASNSTSIRTNVALSSKEHKYTLDADYEILNKTLLRGVLERRKVEYVHGDVPSATEDKAVIELRRAVSDVVTGAFSYARKERRADSYNKNQWFNTSYPSPGAAATTANSNTSAYFTNNPQIRQFLYADYDEDRVRLNGNWNASETISLQGTVDAFKQKNDKMNCADVATDLNVAAGTAAINALAPGAVSWQNDCLGRTAVNGNTATLDSQWQPDEALTTFLFYTYSDYTLKQRGRSWGSGASAGQLQVADDTNRDFTAETSYKDHTVGLGAKWAMTPKWELGGQYVYTRSIGNTAVSLVPGSALSGLYNPISLPDTKSRTQSAQIYAKWNYSSRLTFRVNYMYEDMKLTDWSYDNLSATSTAGILMTGELTPRYTNHVIGASVAVSTW